MYRELKQQVGDELQYYHLPLYKRTPHVQSMMFVSVIERGSHSRVKLNIAEKYDSSSVFKDSNSSGRATVVLRACLQEGRVTLASGLTPAGGRKIARVYRQYFANAVTLKGSGNTELK